METEEVYGRFVAWLKQSWYGVPQPEEALPLIRARYTKEEAALLTGMPFAPKPLKDLAVLKEMAPERLREILDRMARKGLVYQDEKEGSLRYGLNDLFFGMRTFGWPGRIDETSRAVAPPANHYWEHGFLDPWEPVREKGLRVLPIEETIEDTREVRPYEDVIRLLDSFNYFVVTVCPCKHIKNIDPNELNCPYPSEVCLHFDKLGHYIVDNGLGREITRRETEEILKKSAEAGLVHGISNQQEGIDTICNCDPCCCMWFTALFKLKHAGSLTPSNYRVRTHPVMCLGCGLCVKRCPMKALRLENHHDATNKKGVAAVLDPEMCIGCGVCVYKCKSQSLKLEQRETVHDPPRTGRDFAMQFMMDHQAAQARGDGKS
jgi:Na+-translocating ferredoxin:NAD+ oxidoreductase subunit B